jgi:hypothetical protein
MLFCGISAINIYGFNMVQSTTVIPGRFEESLPFNAHCSVGVRFGIPFWKSEFTFLLRDCIQLFAPLRCLE